MCSGMVLGRSRRTWSWFCSVARVISMSSYNTPLSSAASSLPAKNFHTWPRRVSGMPLSQYFWILWWYFLNFSSRVSGPRRLRTRPIHLVCCLRDFFLVVELTISAWFSLMRKPRVSYLITSFGSATSSAFSAFSPFSALSFLLLLRTTAAASASASFSSAFLSNVCTSCTSEECICGIMMCTPPDDEEVPRGLPACTAALLSVVFFLWSRLMLLNAPPPTPCRCSVVGRFKPPFAFSSLRMALPSGASFPSLPFL
mmetsp:Transcript_18595/g.71762  ORF Transcript_18595/g.71762 Transcript_18595/m.71762 type:complete len:256 (-) Transcript_18595:1532-2299(-)